MDAWGSCFSGLWGLVFFCRLQFDSHSIRRSFPRCLTYSLGLPGVQWVVGNSCGARKLTRTPHAIKKNYSWKWGLLIVVNLLWWILLFYIIRGIIDWDIYPLSWRISIPNYLIFFLKFSWILLEIRICFCLKWILYLKPIEGNRCS